MSGIATAVVAGAVIGAVVNKTASDKSIQATPRASDPATAQTQTSTSQARADLNRIFPNAQQTGQQGFQGALDVLGQSLPAQTNVFQQGNVGAQQQILQGLPQIQNALFGNPVDLSQLQPFQMQQPDLSFFQQQLPQSINPLGPPTNQQMGAGFVLPPNDIFTGPLQQIGNGQTNIGANNRFSSGFNPQGGSSGQFNPFDLSKTTGAV